jgi:hypothetical protein
MDIGRMGNLRCEAGRATLSSSTVEIPTTLNTVLVALVMPTASVGANDAIYVAETLPLTGAASVTVTNANGAQSQTLAYLLIGY